MTAAGAALPTIVISDTLSGSFSDVRIVKRADAHREIAALKQAASKDILITGSRTLWNDLVAHGLVDEIHLMIGNLVLGAGVLLFAARPPDSLRLLEVRAWPGSNNVLLRYALDRQR